MPAPSFGGVGYTRNSNRRIRINTDNPEKDTMQSIISLDLETTGLDPQRDAIIEIGVVRFQGSRIEGTWEQLVNPGRPVPPFVTQLTGINDSMLTNAPRFRNVMLELEAFVGDSPILGHSIGFDLSFLRKQGLFADNLTMDTYDLASTLMPSASRYRLGAVATALGVFPGNAHRALDDAKTVHQVYLRLFDFIHKLPPPLVEEIVRMGEDLEWGAGPTFEEVFEQIEISPDLETVVKLFDVPEGVPKQNLEPRDEILPLDTEELSAILQPGGQFAKKFSAYEHRSQQLAMLESVAESISNSNHLLVEAGTGTGKSLAYLIPAFAWAEQNGERVVVSTNTINLQDQLSKSDIPTINEVLGTDYHGAVLKGRRNYICPRRLDAIRRLGPRTAEEMRVVAKLLVWLVDGGSGDRNEINLNGPDELAAWNRLSAESEDCTPENCSRYGSKACPYFLARENAEKAHVVIVNHALLLADISTGNRVIPEYQYLIVDEAHHLESATTRGLSFRVTEGEFRRLLNDLGASKPGILNRVILFGRKWLTPSHSAELEASVNATIDGIKECHSLVKDLFESLDHFLLQQREERPVGPYGQQVRITNSVRTLPDWSQVEVVWDRLRDPLADSIRTILEIGEGIVDLDSGEEDQGQDLFIALRTTGHNLAEIVERLDQLIFEPDPKMIYWLHVSATHERISLHAAPLEIGHLVEEFLWNEKESVVMTSATMTTAGDFDYIRQRLSAHDADELMLGSPFDYETSTLLYLVNDIPEPSERQAYQRAIDRGILNLTKATEGRTLGLFTSFAQLRSTARSISSPLASNGIQVYVQGEGSSRHTLLETFRTSDKAVLLGTRSFWEGVDVPGEALSVLVITKLPFDVPNDPIIEARSETYEMPFDQYTVPEAILRFRQGFGRLIRTRSDRGIVAVFDKRIISKRYGRIFLDSLPTCSVRSGSMADLPNAALRWLGD
jgi:DNA polymerase-3 subunit epsilon/ATP-dependent DNA helicase DinG